MSTETELEQAFKAQVDTWQFIAWARNCYGFGKTGYEALGNLQDQLTQNGYGQLHQPSTMPSPGEEETLNRLWGLAYLTEPTKVVMGQMGQIWWENQEAELVWIIDPKEVED